MQVRLPIQHDIKNGDLLSNLISNICSRYVLSMSVLTLDT